MDDHEPRNLPAVEDPEGSAGAALTQGPATGGTELVFTPSRPKARSARRSARSSIRTRLRRAPAVAKRRKWAILSILVLGLVSGWILQRSQPTLFTAEGSIWVETDDGVDGTGTNPVLPPAAWADLLTSWTVLDSVVAIHRLHLRFPPGREEVFSDLQVSEEARPGEYVLAMAENGQARIFDARGNLLAAAHPDSAIGSKLGLYWPAGPNRLPPGEVAPFSISTKRDAAQSLAGDLQIDVGPEGNLIRVRLPSSDGVRAAAVVNEVMSRAVSLATALKLEQIDDRAEVLDEQLSRAEAQLRAAERAYQRFQVAAAPTGGSGASGDPAAARVIQLRVDADQWRIDRERLEALLAEIPSSGVRIEAMEVIPSVREATELAGALRELARVRADIRRLELGGDEARLQLQRSLAESFEDRAIPRLGTALVTQLRDREEQAEAQTADATALLTTIPPQRIEEARLSRRVAVAAALYEDLYRSSEDAGLAQAVARPDIRVLDSAVASLNPDPSAQAPIAAVVLVTLLALLLGPMVLERMDPFLRSGADIVEGLGAQILGVLPRIRPGDAKNPDAQERAVEALRLLRQNLTMALHGQDGMSFAISSPSAGDGKSITAANLAFAFAELGRGVLLMDADTRHGRLHEAVGAEAEPGLTDVLLQECSLSEAIQDTPVDGVELLAAGSLVSNGPELLGHADFESHLSGLREQYDVVIVDCPALENGGDAVLTGISAGAVVLVLRYGRTRKEQAAESMEWLSRFPVRLAGAVFNDVPRQEARTIRPTALPVYKLPIHSAN
ncbi:MAG: polysaccharide biosynthesis tyrosine autokinase [Gemmatimonadetes bacterium]|nr:polysaccharide biosynthesis tyrosine autokinase [Gemmatimonadota bacterium]